MIKCYYRRLKVIWQIRFYAEFFFFALIDLPQQKETQCQLFHQSLTLLATDSFERWMEPPETRLKWVTSNLVLAPRTVRFYLRHTIGNAFNKMRKIMCTISVTHHYMQRLRKAIRKLIVAYGFCRSQESNPGHLCSKQVHHPLHDSPNATIDVLSFLMVTLFLNFLLSQMSSFDVTEWIWDLLGQNLTQVSWSTFSAFQAFHDYVKKLQLCGFQPTSSFGF